MFIPIIHPGGISDRVTFVFFVVAVVSLLSEPLDARNRKNGKTHETTAQRWQPTPRLARPTNWGGRRMGPHFLVFLTGPYGKRIPPKPEIERRGKHTKPPHSVGNKRLGWRATKLGSLQIYGKRGPPRTTGKRKTDEPTKPPHSVGNQRLGVARDTRRGRGAGGGVPQISA